jgi:hypothetical protein
MGNRKWKAGQADEVEEPSFLKRFRKPIAIAAIALAAVAFFIYRFNNSKYRYGDPRSDYNRTLAECVQDRTQVNVAGAAIEDAAEACLRDTPAPPGASHR